MVIDCPQFFWHQSVPIYNNGTMFLYYIGFYFSFVDRCENALCVLGMVFAALVNITFFFVVVLANTVAV